MSNLIKATFNNQTIWASKAQIEALEVLTSTNAGGIAVVHGYVSESGRITPEVADITFISRFSYERLNNRKLAYLESLTLDDIQDDIKSPKLVALKATELQEVFDKRKAYLIESINKTLSGDRDDARRAAHDRCYLRISEGVRVHYKTVPDDKGIKQPVTLEDFPIVESILVEFLEINRKIIEPGEFKTVNSGVDVLIGNVIESNMPKSAKFKNLSLKENNFTSLKIGGQELLTDDIKGLFT